MRKTRLFAAALAAVSVMSLTVPAFAEDQSIADNNVESSVEASDEAAIFAADAEMNENAYEYTDNVESSNPEGSISDTSAETMENADNAGAAGNTDSAVNAADEEENSEGAQTIDEFENKVVTVADTSHTYIYQNDQGMTVYEAENAVAYVNPEGTSGRIYINQNKLNKQYDVTDRYTYSFDSVGDVALKDIMKFNDGGYVSNIFSEIRPTNSIYDDHIEITAKGPSMGNGAGYLKFTDYTGDVYSKDIYACWESQHSIGYNSAAPDIKIIDWYSYSYENKEFPEYEFKKDTSDSANKVNVYKNDKGQTVYECKDMTVYVNSDGISGQIDINASVFSTINAFNWRNSDHDNLKTWEISTVGDERLSSIMKFNDRGYVSKIKCDYDPTVNQMYIVVYGAGPSGIFAGSGHMEFIPLSDKDETDTLSIWLHNADSHSLKLNSSNPIVKTIRWWS